ncbi:MAG: DUF3096 domain-containing protein [Xanthomonadaceae bacterium]|nr:DUF3096 domain-containing protein [Xanthomonadaceae bacterium]
MAWTGRRVARRPLEIVKYDILQPGRDTADGTIAQSGLAPWADSLIGFAARFTGDKAGSIDAAQSFSSTARHSTIMNMTISLAPLLSLIAGILILLIPGMLRIIVAVYLIAMGIIGLTGMNF